MDGGRFFPTRSELGRWFLKFGVVAALALLMDHFLLSRTLWPSDFPIGGYAYVQHTLQKQFEAGKKTSEVAIVDISKLIPRSNPDQSESDAEEATRLENQYLALADMLTSIGKTNPKMMLIDWDIASPPVRGNAAIQAHKDLMSLIRTSKVPIRYLAERGLTTGKATLPPESLRFAASGTILTKDGVGAYSAYGLFSGTAGLNTLPYRALLDSGGRFESSPSLRSSELSVTVNGQRLAAFWVNFEAVPHFLRTSAQLSNLIATPFLTDEEIAKVKPLLQDKFVLIGDVSNPTAGDRAEIPLIDATADLKESAGILHHASALHTLRGNQLYQWNGFWAEQAFGLAWAFVWFLVLWAVKRFAEMRLKLQEESFRTEFYHLAFEIVFTIVATIAMLWLAGRADLHRMLIPSVGGIGIIILLDLLRETGVALIKAHHLNQTSG